MDFDPKAADQILAAAQDTTKSEEDAALHLAACLAALIIEKQTAIELVATVYDSTEEANQ